MKQYLLLGALCAFSLSAFAKPDPVDSVSTAAISSSSVNVSWSAVDGATYYDVYQDNERFANLITDTSLVVDGLSAETQYKYFVTACDIEGRCSIASSSSRVTTLAASDSGSTASVCGTEGRQPVVTYVERADGLYTLNWCSVEGAEGYNLFVNNEYFKTVDAAITTYDITARPDDVLQVAYYANGEFPSKSDPATPVSTTTPPAQPPTQPPLGMTDVDMLANLEQNSIAGPGVVEIFFTRHAEKETELRGNEDGSFTEVCGEEKCSEVLNAKGEFRAELLVDAFQSVGITARLTHAFSSHKTRTRQTIEQIVAQTDLTGDNDKNPNDGIQEFPILNGDGVFATELNPEGTSGSEAPTIAALLNLPEGSTALVAGHSGTLYDIMAGLGLTDVCLSDTVETCNQDRYPIDNKVKVKNFGDIWKINLVDGVATFIYRINLQPLQLELNELAK